MLGDAERAEEIRLLQHNFRRQLITVKIAELSGDGFDNLRIRVTNEKAAARTSFRHQPKPGETTGNQVFFNPEF